MKTKVRFQPGDKVRLTGKFLRSTGQMVGGEGQSRWTVLECPCKLCRDGRFVRTDEQIEQPLRYWTAEDLAADPHLASRHFNADNLEKVK